VVQEEDTYFLSGRKHLITFGVHCDYWLLFARREGTRGADGTVALMVDRHAPGASAYITGQTLVVDGGLSIVAPPFPEDLTPPLSNSYELLLAPYQAPHC
jgi:hypothetical protein